MFIRVSKRGFTPLFYIPLSFEGVDTKGELKRGKASLI